MRIGAPDLDDVEAIIAADVDGLMHSVARAGAQVRAVAEAVREGVLAPLADFRPRAVVVVTGTSSTAATAADLVMATLAPRFDAPIVVAPVLPGWIGPLDAVVILGEDAGDMALADAAARSLRRRAEVVIGAPIEGPLRDAVADNVLDLSGRMDIDPRFRFPAHVAVLAAVLGGLSQVRFSGPGIDLDAIADALDAEAAANHVSGDSFRNRAKLLAERLVERPVVLAGDTPAGRAAATRGSQMLLAVAGIVSTATDFQTAATMPVPVEVGGVDTDSLFYDPDIDGPGPLRRRVFVLSAPRREWFVRERIMGIADAELITSDIDAPHETDIAAATTDAPADLETFLVHLLRIDMAAVYLRLIGA